MGYSKYKLAEDNLLSLTLGPYVKLLEFATGIYPCVMLRFFLFNFLIRSLENLLNNFFCEE
jgi:hypothetical protein